MKVLTILYRILKALMNLTSLAMQILKALQKLQEGQDENKRQLQDLSEDMELLIENLIPQPAVKLEFTSNVEGVITEGVTQMKLTDSQSAVLSIAPKDKKNNPAILDGAPVWNSSNTEVLTVTPAADGLSATVSAVGPLGTATVSVTADADLGAGVTELAGSVEVTVTAGAATTIEITAGDPIEN